MNGDHTWSAMSVLRRGVSIPPLSRTDHESRHRRVVSIDSPVVVEKVMASAQRQKVVDVVIERVLIEMRTVNTTAAATDMTPRADSWRQF